MRLAVIGKVVRRDHDHRVSLGDAVSNRRIADIIVVGRAREEPVVAGIRARVGVGRVTHVNRAHSGPRLAVHTGDRGNGRRVRKTGVGRAGTGVQRDRDSRIRRCNMPRAARRRRQHIVTCQ